MKDNRKHHKETSFKNETVRRFNPTTSRKKQLSALVVALVYLLHGFIFDSWHPFWVIFLILPALALFRYERIRPLMRASLIAFLVSIALYFTIAHYTGLYHPTWLIMLTPLFIGLQMEKHLVHRWMLEGALLLSILTYLAVGMWTGDYALALFAFLLFIIPAIITGHIYIHLHAIDSLVARIGLIISFIVFFLWGYLFDQYAIAWVALLFVPTMSVAFHAKGRDTLVPFSVYVSLLLFYILGYYTGAWHIVWTVFLLGPAVSLMQKL